jgi:hypothetical protein
LQGRFVPFLAIARTSGLVYALVAMTMLARPASAQQPSQPSPDVVQQQMAAMGPMMAQMTRAMLQSGLEFYAQPTTARSLATFSKNYLDALVAVGFTREEALRVVAAHGLPTLPGAGR